MKIRKIAAGIVILLTVFSLGCMEENHRLKHIWTKNFNGPISAVGVSDGGVVAVGLLGTYVNGPQHGEEALQVFDLDGRLLWSRGVAVNEVVISDEGMIFATDGMNVYLFDQKGDELWNRSFDEIGKVEVDNVLHIPNGIDQLYIENNTFAVVDFDTKKAYYLNISGGLIKTEEFEKFPKNVASRYGYNARFAEDNLYLLETFKDDEKLWTQPTAPSISCFDIPYDQDYFVAGVLAPKWSFTECGRISLMDFEGNLKGNYTECKPLTAFLFNNFNIYSIGISDNGRYIAASPVSEVKLLEVIEK
jgi:hypothetical protein